MQGSARGTPWGAMYMKMIESGQSGLYLCVFGDKNLVLSVSIVSIHILGS